MRKIVFSLLVLFSISLLSKAQNVQLHYDLGEDRQMFTTTVEMFKPDKFGSTFFFMDLDYGSKVSEVEGISLAYWEIARSFKWGESQKFEPRVEYNGGFGRGQFALNDTTISQYHYPINSAWLVGGQYTFNNADFSRVLTIQANYKYIKDKHDAAFQLTAVWGLHFLDRKLSFTGFADFWMEDNGFVTDGNITTTEFVFLSEPQIWYNFTEKFSVGGEIELGYNFGGVEGMAVNPTLGLKYSF